MCRWHRMWKERICLALKSFPSHKNSSLIPFRDASAVSSTSDQDPFYADHVNTRDDFERNKAPRMRSGRSWTRPPR